MARRQRGRKKVQTLHGITPMRFLASYFNWPYEGLSTIIFRDLLALNINFNRLSLSQEVFLWKGAQAFSWR